MPIFKGTIKLQLRTERLERDGLNWLLKLWMGTQRVQMKEVLPWLVAWLVVPCRYKRFLFCHGCSSRPMQYPRRTLFHFLCPHRPASWACSRAGSPVSKFVSLSENISVFSLMGITVTLLHFRVDPKCFEWGLENPSCWVKKKKSLQVVKAKMVSFDGVNTES